MSFEENDDGVRIGLLRDVWQCIASPCFTHSPDYHRLAAIFRPASGGRSLRSTNESFGRFSAMLGIKYDIFRKVSRFVGLRFLSDSPAFWKTSLDLPALKILKHALSKMFTIQTCVVLGR